MAEPEFNLKEVRTPHDFEESEYPQMDYHALILEYYAALKEVEGVESCQTR